MRPLYTKIGEALDKVAEAEGYTQILTANSSLAYYSNDYDVTLLVTSKNAVTIFFDCRMHC